MNTFLHDQFPKLTTNQLSNIDKLYPKAEQFPNSGPYWRSVSNAYGEMRYICPGIFFSQSVAKHTTGSGIDSSGSDTPQPSQRHARSFHKRSKDKPDAISPPLRNWNYQWVPFRELCH
jgi:hypothetical protein